MSLRLINTISYFRGLQWVLYQKRHMHTCLPLFTTQKFVTKKEFITETNLKYLENPDTFGTLANPVITHTEPFVDEGDVIEEKFLQELPHKSQKLTIRQYADLMKQYIENKRLKEAIDVLEVRMLKEDRVKPENYTYNLLIGACADVGYTKKAFSLFNDMKKRALKPTGATYTCLFEACSNSPCKIDGLKRATKLRNLMIEKGIEPNLTNFNAMIKSFGRNSDLITAFQIADDMVFKKIKIRVHTFNHLLQTCISNKDSGLKYALLVWRKMLRMREKPNIYSFNLMLKCVQDCNIGSEEEVDKLVKNIMAEEQIPLQQLQTLKLHADNIMNTTKSVTNKENILPHPVRGGQANKPDIAKKILNTEYSTDFNKEHLESSNNLVPVTNVVNIELINNISNRNNENEDRNIPNLLSKDIKMDGVLNLNKVISPQDKFALIGGLEDFLKEMNVHSVQPDIKTFTQMLPLLDNNIEAENKLLEHMKSLKIKPDIDFYNMLMKKRCMRLDYENALAVKELIKVEAKRRHHLNKNQRLRFNIMTYGILALTCTTKEKADILLNEMKEKRIKVNVQILGALLKNAITSTDFPYILHVMYLMKLEKIHVNAYCLKKLEEFNKQCLYRIEQQKINKPTTSLNACKKFNRVYTNWLKDINVDEVLKEEDPFQQFKESVPKTIQNDQVVIEEPKRFYKRNRKHIKYVIRQ